VRGLARASIRRATSVSGDGSPDHAEGNGHRVNKILPLLHRARRQVDALNRRARRHASVMPPDFFRHTILPLMIRHQQEAFGSACKEYSMTSISRTALIGAGIAAMLIAAPVVRAQSPAPPGASVYFINLKDGDAVTSPFKVLFGLTGMGVAPAGVEKDKTGHHHLLIDAKLSAEEAKAPLAMDAKHMHFGGGQTETTLTLPPGRHTLQMVLGDWSHVPFAPPIVSPVITVMVK
jgi:hypothetical protein